MLSPSEQNFRRTAIWIPFEQLQQKWACICISFCDPQQLYLCIKNSNNMHVPGEKPKPKRKNAWIYIYFFPFQISLTTFSHFMLFSLVLNLFFPLQGRNPTSCKSIQASFTYLISIFVPVRYFSHPLIQSLLIFPCIWNQQFCRLHVTTLLRIFSFFPLDIKIVILIFFSQVLAGLFFCSCILFPYWSQYKGKHGISNFAAVECNSVDRCQK